MRNRNAMRGSGPRSGQRPAGVAGVRHLLRVAPTLRASVPMPGLRLSRTALAGAAALAAGCGADQSIMNPAGPAAREIAALWWVMLALAIPVFVLVVVVLAGGAMRHRPADQSSDRPDDRRVVRWVVLGGGLLPTLVALGLFVYSVRLLGALSPPPDPGELTVEVEGRQWWWDIRYRDSRGAVAFRTANELHVPAGRRVRLVLTSSDVIHSFWIPRLHGKMDLIPGMEIQFWIEADRPGVYRGQCAEYCGLQHTRMAIQVVAHDAGAFDAWFRNQRAPAAVPGDSLARRGLAVFQQRGCAACHAIRGTGAAGVLGPDLTHLATRRTIAAGTLPNTPGTLASWIANPQQIKPGNLMPQVPLPAGDLNALRRYLEGLR